MGDDRWNGSTRATWEERMGEGGRADYLSEPADVEIETPPRWERMRVGITMALEGTTAEEVSRLLASPGISVSGYSRTRKPSNQSSARERHAENPPRQPPAYSWGGVGLTSAF